MQQLPPEIRASGLGIGEIAEQQDAIQNDSDSDRGYASSDDEDTRLKASRRKRARTTREENKGMKAEEKYTVGVDEDGNEMMKFNLDDEREDGEFDVDGTFVKNKEEMDGWVNKVEADQALGNTGAQAETVQRNRDQAQKLEQGKEKFLANPDYLEEEELSEDRCRYIIKELLTPGQGETVQQAITRFSSGKTKQKKRKPKKRRRNTTARSWDISSESDDENTTMESVNNGANPEKFNLLTEVVNKLTTQFGDFSVYSQTYEDICSKLQKSKWEILWIYKWKEGDKSYHGPFTTEQMTKWSKAGYFEKGTLCGRYEGYGKKVEWEKCDEIDFEEMADFL